MMFKVGDRVKFIGMVRAEFYNKTASVTKIENSYVYLDNFEGPGTRIITNGPYNVKTSFQYIVKTNSTKIKSRLGIK